MGEYLITTGGVTYQVAGDADVDAYLAWLVEVQGEPARLSVLSVQQVLSRLRCSALPAEFPLPDVVIGEKGTAVVRGWFAGTVESWEQAPAESESSRSAESPDGLNGGDGEPETAAPVSVDKRPAGKAAPWWSGVPTRADALVAIVTSRGVVAPSGAALTRGPLPAAEDLGRFVWHRWPVQSGKKGATPQLWITAEALRAAGMNPPKKPLTSSDDLSGTVGKLFGCTVTTARAGWFTVMFAPPEGTGEGRRVHLVLLPFLWLDAAGQRRNDRGLAGTVDTSTALPDDEASAAQVLGERIAWLAGLADTTDKHRGDPPLLPTRVPASVGSALLDTVRRRSRSSHRLEVCPIPDLVYAETPRLEPSLEWKNMPHDAKGDAVDVEVDQRAAYLASVGQVNLGYGAPAELTKVEGPALFEGSKAPFGLWRVTVPPGAELDGLDRRLPLPLQHMSWDAAETFWCTTRSVQHLLAPVADGGAGMIAAQLNIDRAWVWPGQARLLRGWADVLRDELATATAAGQQDRIDVIKNVYKAFLGRMAGSDHPPGQRHYQQPAWVATVHADTRWRAMRYVTHIADTHAVFPIFARDIDTWGYRLSGGTDPSFLNEQSGANGKYRVKKAG